MALTKAKRAVLAKWSKALRSGKYKQGQFALRSGDGFCCFGVLCDTVDPDGWAGGDRYHRGYIGAPSDKVRRQAGLCMDDIAGLVDLNDNEAASFEEIADVVDWIRWSS